MKDVVITFNNGKTVHYPNSEFININGRITIKQYVLKYNYNYNESEIKEIKYEG